jgi:toxin ParE1/3/4
VAARKALRLDWSPAAERNLENQLNYIARHNPSAAGRVLGRIEAGIERLLDFPESGRAGRVRGLRELVVTGTPYVIVYRLKADVVTIVRVLHGAQRWPPGRG